MTVLQSQAGVITRRLARYYFSGRMLQHPSYVQAHSLSKHVGYLNVGMHFSVKKNSSLDNWEGWTTPLQLLCSRCFLPLHTRGPHAASSGVPGVSEALACNCTLCPRSARSSNLPKSSLPSSIYMCWSYVSNTFKDNITQYTASTLAQEHGWATWGPWTLTPLGTP